MTNKNIYMSLGGLDLELVAKAAPTEKVTRKKNSIWLKWISIAACLFLIIMSGIFANLFAPPDTPDVSQSNILSYFVITAHAANGESTELNVSDNCFNSGTPKNNIFGHDMPTFNFSVSPSDLKSNESVYGRFDISISYNGTLVEGKDDHILIGYMANINHPSGKPYAYSIIGWFTEQTDIVITITDKESREIVETITLTVKYLADKQEYELKVTNLTTKFSEQKEAVNAHNVLMSYFFSKGYVTNYPEWFGGCYIKGNKLYIKLVSPSDEEAKNVSQILAPFDNVIVYKNAEMSMADLQECADKTAKELTERGYAVTSWYVDSITGNIIISVLEKDFEAVTEWVNTASQIDNAPKIVIEIGRYVDLDNQVIEFCAEPFLQHATLSWMYSMNIKIDLDNEKIYLNEILYDQVSYVEDFDLDYGFLFPSNNIDEIVTEAIDKINSQKGCYILETQSESKYGQKIAMYVIGDTYYFIRFFDNGSVMRIHSGTVHNAS